jgi:hypothetical protein
MQTTQYFQHARSLGAFRAEDALAVARQAAELDRVAALKAAAQPTVAWYEVLPDGSGMVRFSNGVKVY